MCSVISDSFQPYGPSGASVHGISQARMLEWIAISSSIGSSSPRDQTTFLTSPAITSRFFTTHCTSVLVCLLTNWEPEACSVQMLSRVWLRPHGLQQVRAFLSLIISQSLLKFMSIESVMPSKLLIFCHPLLLLPSIFLCIFVFSSESAFCIRWPKYWSFSFSISLSNEYLGLIFFRIDGFDLLAVQGTLKSLLQCHSSKAPILQCSAFFLVHLSYLYMTTGKTIALTIQTFVSKVMSLFFNMLSRLVLAFLPKSKCLLISWLQSPSAVVVEPKK